MKTMTNGQASSIQSVTRARPAPVRTTRASPSPSRTRPVKQWSSTRPPSAGAERRSSSPATARRWPVGIPPRRPAARWPRAPGGQGVDRRRAGRDVGVEAAPEGESAPPGVRRRSVTSRALLAKGVGEPQVEHEGVGRLGVQAQLHRAGGGGALLGHAPRAPPAHQAVDGVAGGRLADRRLDALPAEGVEAAGQAVGPRYERLPATAAGHLAGAVAVEDRHWSYVGRARESPSSHLDHGRRPRPVDSAPPDWPLGALMPQLSQVRPPLRRHHPSRLR